MDFLTAMLEDGYTWYTFSFLIFGFIIVKLGFQVINNDLDGRITSIKKELEESESLRVEAQEMLAQYKRKQRDAQQEADKIINTAKENADKFKEKAAADFDDILKRREAQLDDRLKSMEQNAINSIQAYAADLAINAASKIIVDKLDSKTNAKLVKQSLTDVAAHIN